MNEYRLFLSKNKGLTYQPTRKRRWVRFSSLHF